MIAYLFENGKVRRCEYPSYTHLMMSVTKRNLERMLYYPADDAYIVRMSPNGTMLMHSADPNQDPTSDIAFYNTAFVWLQSQACWEYAYQPLATHGSGPCVIRPQPDSGSNWNVDQYGEWADGTTDVFTRFLCLRDNGIINSSNGSQ